VVAVVIAMPWSLIRGAFGKRGVNGF